MQRFLAICLLVVFGSTALVAQTPQAGTATDPIIGNWKLNYEKSSWSPGPRPPAGGMQVRKYEYRAADGFMVTTNVGVDGLGVGGFNQVIAKLDGRDYPQPTNLTMAAGAKPTTQSYRIIDAYTVERRGKSAEGAPTGTTSTRAVSRDGKTMTETTKGTNAQGQQINNVLVFDRVQ